MKFRFKKYKNKNSLMEKRIYDKRIILSTQKGVDQKIFHVI